LNIVYPQQTIPQRYKLIFNTQSDIRPTGEGSGGR